MKTYKTKFKTKNKKHDIPQQIQYFTPENEQEEALLETESKKMFDIEERVKKLRQKAIEYIEEMGVSVKYGTPYLDDDGNNVGFYDYIKLKHLETRGVREAAVILDKLFYVEHALSELSQNRLSLSEFDYKEHLVVLMADMFSIVDLSNKLTAYSYIDKAISGSHRTSEATKKKSSNMDAWLELALPIYERYLAQNISGSQASVKTMKRLNEINNNDSSLSLKLPNDKTHIRKLLASRLKEKIF